MEINITNCDIMRKYQKNSQRVIFMKGPGIKEYLAKIDHCKLDGVSKEFEYIEITSKDLHSIISTQHNTMATCCQAMYKRLLKGDQILQLPKGKTGFGARLTIRYYLHELDNRELMIERKQRGRPKKYDDDSERPNSNINWKTEKLMEILSEWVQKQGCNIQQQEEDIICAIKEDGTKWILRVHGIRRGRKSTLVHKINHLFGELEEDNACYSLVVNDDGSHRKQWEEIPMKIKEKLNLSIIVAGRNGTMEEL